MTKQTPSADDKQPGGFTLNIDPTPLDESNEPQYNEAEAKPPTPRYIGPWEQMAIDHHNKSS